MDETRMEGLSTTDSAQGTRNNIDISNTLIFAAMERIERLQEETLKCTQSVENTVKEVKTTLDGMETRLEKVTTRMQTLEATVATLQEENAALWEKCNELEAYRRHWNLRVSGIPEKAGEDTRRLIIDLFGQVSPASKDLLALSVDIRHQLQRAVIQPQHHCALYVQSPTRSDLELDATSERGSQVEQARKEGKKAGFREAFAYIDGWRLSFIVWPRFNLRLTLERTLERLNGQGSDQLSGLEDWLYLEEEIWTHSTCLISSVQREDEERGISDSPLNQLDPPH
ncbi:hypothetical protein WMY93_034074 [Mugilogobius chulae]|uniref:Uncharacterized protein n=1 Tax=Mugilogobius chulae TaxID=88201 RepID=A0AAW0MQR8_9GOBI